MASIISLSERLDAVKRKAAHIDCKLTKSRSEQFRDELEFLLVKLEDTVDAEADREGVYDNHAPKHKGN